MAGNIVKWWRQFKQYKQFSVLQECTTDSEELIYKAQVPSNTPPDILLTSHRPSVITTTTSNKNTNDKVANQEIFKQSSKSCRNIKESRASQSERLEKERLQKRHSIATTRNLESLEAHKVKLNELSCDVSFNESPKSSQPVQFSFTLYDLDGSHGKLTKDDIAGIVSTIYESIGNTTVVVPHYGKKTINVKLTVSSEAKSNTLLNTNRSFKKNHVSISEDSEGASDSYKARFKMKNFGSSSKMNAYESVNNVKSKKIDRADEEEAIYVENIKKEVLKHFTAKKMHIEEENDPNTTRSQHKQFVAPSKKKILRKQRKKQRTNNESSIRGRSLSLSVGNDFRWRKSKCADDELECNEKNLRKHELIEIIRESMEKNRLCFQNKGKSNVFERAIRPRKNTLQCTKEAKSRENCTETDHNLCGFDSFLHSTKCTNLNSFTKLESFRKEIFPRGNCRNSSNLDSPVLSQLKTSVLNQLDKNLTPEQKLTMKFNDVEKWLHERHDVSQQESINIDAKVSASEISFEKNLFNSSPKSATNEKISTKKNVLRAPHHHHLKQRKEAINSSRNKSQFENLRIASECENLICTEEEEYFNESETASKSSLKFVHIHHHFYHFEDDEGKFE